MRLLVVMGKTYARSARISIMATGRQVDLDAQ